MRKRKNPTLKELIPDAELRQRVTDQLYSGGPLFGQGSVFSEMLQSMVNAALDGEADYFLEEQASMDPEGTGNRRNGYTSKTVRSTAGPLAIKTPRDRLGEHEPILVKKRERELRTGMDEIILGLYARGGSVADIRKQVLQLYGVELSEGLISAITDKVLDDVTAWQQRPLEPAYVVVYMDAIHYRTRQDGLSQAKAVHTVYGVNTEGERDILGLYLFDSEGARAWVKVMEDMRRRGVEQVLIFCVDGLPGFKEAIQDVFPHAVVQRCIVHKLRRSVRFVAWKDLKAVCADLRMVYTAAGETLARQSMEVFARKWQKQYPEIAEQWNEEWDDLMAFMRFTAPVRRLIYTTNPVEAVHRAMRKVTKSKGTWPNDRSLIKQLFLALKYNESGWKKTTFNWRLIHKDLVKEFGVKYTKYLKE